jgi:glycerol-3-phosphate dehydrogenase
MRPQVSVAQHPSRPTTALVTSVTAGAIIVPHARDGGVMFAIPWHEHALAAPQTPPIPERSLEPRPRAEEIDFILETTGRYLHHAPTRADVLSVFVGIRRLVRSGDSASTAGRHGMEGLFRREASVGGQHVSVRGSVPPLRAARRVRPGRVVQTDRVSGLIRDALRRQGG